MRVRGVGYHFDFLLGTKSFEISVKYAIKMKHVKPNLTSGAGKIQSVRND